MRPSLSTESGSRLMAAIYADLRVVPSFNPMQFALHAMQDAVSYE